MGGSSIRAGIFAGTLFGYGTGIIAGALIPLTNQYGFDPLSAGLITATALLGALLGALFAGPVADRVGRLNALSIGAVLFGIGSVLSAITLFGIMPLLITGRLIVGLGIGFVSAVAPMYLSEVAPAARRGLGVGLYQSLVASSMVVAYLVGFALQGSENGWRVMFALGLVLALGQLLCNRAGLESPVYLRAQGELEHAEGNTRALGLELESISAGQASRPWSAFLHRPGRHFLILAATLAGAQILTGINVLLYYAPTMFINAGITDSSGAFVAVIIIGVVNAIGTFIGLAVIERFNRRTLLVVGAAGMTLSMAGVALIAAFGAATSLATVMVGLLMAFVLFFEISIGPVAWLMISELMPAELRGKGVSFAVMVNWALNTA